MSKVRDYYDANTWKWLLSGTDGALHRELWGPGTSSRREAMHYVHRRVLDHVLEQSPSGEARVVDLGCGVGAGAVYLAGHIACDVHGISLSPRQVAHARRRAARRRGALRGAVTFHEADFCALPPEVADAVAGADLAYAIESFVHAGSAAAFFEQAARVLRPGGRLLLIDDLLTGAGIAANGDPRIESFRAGWQVHSLLSAEQAVAAAAPAGFELAGRTSLSPFMRLGRPRDRLIRALQPVLRGGRRFSMWCQSLVGGDALQRCHQAGLMEYDELVLVRS
jgi:SAM-dependent methyltransferase